MVHHVVVQIITVGHFGPPIFLGRKRPGRGLVALKATRPTELHVPIVRRPPVITTSGQEFFANDKNRKNTILG